MRGGLYRFAAPGGILTLLWAAPLPAVDLAIGSSAGSLRIEGMADAGWLMDADTGLYNSGIELDSTIWEMYFAFVEDGQVQYCDGELVHQGDRITDGTVESTATTLTHTGLTFSHFDDLSADLAVTLDQPVPVGSTNVVAAQWTWTLHNTSDSERVLRVAAWMDADIYLGGDFDENLTAFATGDIAGYHVASPRGAIALGNGNGAVNLDQGVLFDCEAPAGTTASDVTIAATRSLFQVSSSYWVAQGAYNGNGYGAVLGIDPIFANKIEGDADGDNLLDNESDVGAIIEVAVTIPEGEARTVSWRLVYGLDATAAGDPVVPAGGLWVLY